MTQVALVKIASVQRCIERARHEFHAAGARFDEDFTRQDAAILNVVRACEQVIDLANHVIKMKKLGLPQTSAESFALLERSSIIAPDLANTLMHMVAFRNTVVHQYQKTDLVIVRRVLSSGLDDLLAFCDVVKDL